MKTDYRLDVRDPAGDLVAQLFDTQGLHYTRVCNGVGAFALSLRADDPRADLFEPEGQVEIWRQIAEIGLDWYCEEAYLLEDKFDFWKGRVHSVRFAGAVFNSILDRRVISSYASSAESTKNGPAETVMKEVVDEQVGPGAGAGRVYPGLSIQADGAAGNAISKSFAHRNVLQIIQWLSKVGGGDFAIVKTGNATSQFKFYLGQLGDDLRNDILFALNYDNMADPSWSTRWSTVRNAIRVGGQEEEDDREFVWRVAGGVTAQTRREMFVNATNEPLNAGLIARGDAELEKRKLTSDLTFKVAQIPACAYGEHYTLGDLVSARSSGVTVDKKIVSVTFALNRRNQEVVGVKMADV